MSFSYNRKESMFTLADIIDIAIAIERNGAATYARAAERASKPAIASLLRWLAEQEREHERWFEALGRSMPGTSRADDELGSMGRSLLQDIVGDNSLGLDEVDFDSMDSLSQVVNAAIDLEGNTILFYDMLAGLLDEASRRGLETIIEEERRHAKLLFELIDDGSSPSGDDHSVEAGGHGSP